jgi:alanyl-tRNA synthetase
MGDGFSVELCGGTHVQRTGDIGLLRIVSEGGVASGVRRIEAVTGAGALVQVDGVDEALRAVCHELRATPETAAQRLQAVRAEHRELEKELSRLKQKLASAAGGAMADQAVDVSGIKVLAAELPGADAAALRETLDKLKNTLGSAVVLLAASDGDRIALVCGVTADLTSRIKAGDVMRDVAGRLGGKGGGRPDMAQGGGTDVAALASVLAALPAWVTAQIA